LLRGLHYYAINNRNVGDSGGPLLLKSSTALIGLTSFGSGRCKPGTPAGFTKLSRFQAFLDIGLQNMVPFGGPHRDEIEKRIRESVSRMDCNQVKTEVAKSLADRIQLSCLVAFASLIFSFGLTCLHTFGM
jgi:secreted trypsin-like serine protease